MNEYRVEVETARLAAVLDRRGVPLALPPHMAFARDVLAGGSVEAARALPESHPYAEYARGVPWPAGWTWPDIAAHRAEVVLSVASGFDAAQPVEATWDDAGHVYFHGYHRLAAAIAAGLQSVPLLLRVQGEHLPALCEWAWRQPGGPRPYQPIAHPLFVLLGVQPQAGRWEERTAAILDAVRGWAGPILDVGAHLGMLTRTLRLAGHDAEAVDVNAGYAALQPHLVGIGLESIPYRVTSVEEIAGSRWFSSAPCVVCIGLLHHYTGDPRLVGVLRKTILPWMADWAPEAVVEMSLLPEYQGQPAALALLDDAAVADFWRPWGFDAAPIFRGVWSRVVYHLRRREVLRFVLSDPPPPDDAL